MQSTRALCIFLDRYISSGLKKQALYLRRNIANRSKREVNADIKVIELIAAKQTGIWVEPERGVFQVKGIRIEVRNEQLCGALSALPAKHRETVLLHYWEEMPFTEMAARFSVSRRTIYNWHRAALSAMKEILEKQENTP